MNWKRTYEAVAAALRGRQLGKVEELSSLLRHECFIRAQAMGWPAVSISGEAAWQDLTIKQSLQSVAAAMERLDEIENGQGAAQRTPRAIQTEHAGYKFRSRLEARWAVYLDDIGAEWEYEREGFELPSGRYLPDFWIPQVRMWAEVKPNEFAVEAYEKCLELTDATGFPCLMLVGPPENKPYWATHQERNPVPYLLTGEFLGEGRFYANPQPGIRFDDIEHAVTAARSARFEFGESPVPATA